MLGKLFPHTLHFHVFRLDLTREEGEAGLLAGGGEREDLVEVGEEILALFLILLSIPLFFMFSSTLFLSSSSSSSPSSSSCFLFSPSSMLLFRSASAASESEVRVRRYKSKIPQLEEASWTSRTSRTISLKEQSASTFQIYFGLSWITLKVIKQS